MKLILLNGCPAAGKSTVAAQLHKDFPLSLLADVDVWRRMVSGWETNRPQSLVCAYQFTVTAVDAYLQHHSVIVDKAILNHDEVIDALCAAGVRRHAQVFEFILTAEKETILARARKRRETATTILATDEQVLNFWQVTQELIAKRPHAMVIDTTHLTPGEVYEKIKSIVL